MLAQKAYILFYIRDEPTGTSSAAAGSPATPRQAAAGAGSLPNGTAAAPAAPPPLQNGRLPNGVSPAAAAAANGVPASSAPQSAPAASHAKRRLQEGTEAAEAAQPAKRRKAADGQRPAQAGVLRPYLQERTLVVVCPQICICKTLARKLLSSMVRMPCRMLCICCCRFRLVIA